MVYTPFKPSDIDKRINLVELQLGCLFRPHKNCSVLFAIVPRWWWSTLLRLPSLDGCQHSATQHKNATTQFKDRIASNPQSHQLKLKLNLKLNSVPDHSPLHKGWHTHGLLLLLLSRRRRRTRGRGEIHRSHILCPCISNSICLMSSPSILHLSLPFPPSFPPSIPPRFLSSAHLSPTPTSKLT